MFTWRCVKTPQNSVSADGPITTVKSKCSRRCWPYASLSFGFVIFGSGVKWTGVKWIEMNWIVIQRSGMKWDETGYQKSPFGLDFRLQSCPTTTHSCLQSWHFAPPTTQKSSFLKAPPPWAGQKKKSYLFFMPVVHWFLGLLFYFPIGVKSIY